MICGNCLHHTECHIEQENRFYCLLCFKLCDYDEYNLIHKPTRIEKIMEISAKKQ